MRRLGNRILRNRLPQHRHRISDLRQRGCAQRSAAASSRHDEAAARAEICFARKNLTDGARLDNQSPPPPVRSTRHPAAASGRMPLVNLRPGKTSPNLAGPLIHRPKRAMAPSRPKSISRPARSTVRAPMAAVEISDRPLLQPVREFPVRTRPFRLQPARPQGARTLIRRQGQSAFHWLLDQLQREVLCRAQ